MSDFVDGAGGTLADVMPAVLAGLGVPGTTDVLGLPSASKVCVLLVDGLGWQLLREHASVAPFLSSLVAGRAPIRAGFPATTAASIAALGTGVLSGEHGMVGYTFAVADDEVLNALGWHRHGTDKPVDLRERYAPERVQPRRTAFELAADDGVAVHLVAPRDQRDSGLTRAVLRGGRFHGVFTVGDLTSQVLDALGDGDRVLCYAYHGELDLLGHVYGPGSDAWLHQLAHVDRLAAAIAAGLPADGALVVTADHGMIAVGEDDRVDLDVEPTLRDGVRQLGGEARVRHVYTEAGATDDVRSAWRAVLGERALVVGRDDAVAAGWFGPRVAEYVLPRIGDLVVVAHGNLALVRSAVEPRLSGLIGQHGALTPAEQLIPLLVATAAG